MAVAANGRSTSPTCRSDRYESRARCSRQEHYSMLALLSSAGSAKETRCYWIKVGMIATLSGLNSGVNDIKSGG